MEAQTTEEFAGYISYNDALGIIYANVPTLEVEEISVKYGINRVAAEDVVARKDNPYGDVSTRDGFAVHSIDIAGATEEIPVKLPLAGASYAGVPFTGALPFGSAVEICTGALIPEGADAVIAEEFCRREDGNLLVDEEVPTGANIIYAGEDIKAGTVVLKRGEILSPGSLGYIAAAGVNRINVYKHPRAGIVATGDEVVSLDYELQKGQIYSTNLITSGGWFSLFNIEYMAVLAKDNEDDIIQKLQSLLPACDAIITSGGAWGSERDLTVSALDKLGWNKLFHRVRIRPGKGFAFGLWEGVPVFCLPGGPTSNQVAFLQFALPGILRMCGYHYQPLSFVSARLSSDFKGRYKTWTEFKSAKLACDLEGNYVVSAQEKIGRLQSLTESNCLVCIPEGADQLTAGSIVAVQTFNPRYGKTSLPG